ncbi:helix-turn-helix domain-containing protein [Aquimarina litoralis]|uniref:helix-turn-helix domain-containing protein n=1 Tax=Aquimarina litoralis TaxID=584605 RepID=UPI001C578C2A|nr:helix-turn-helix domain-containing protein [Aquimarina litoralis]MBW1295021.1 helix-turn-helix domain-containing protein [Aquimarina litoralis]
MIERFSLEKLKETFADKSLMRDFYLPQTHENLRVPTEPYRSELFGFSLFYKGESNLIADLKEYEVTAPSLIMMSPSVIRQWTMKSSKISCYTFFFKESFLLEHLGNNSIFQKFLFFKQDATHVLQISEEDYTILRPAFDDLLHVNKSNTIHKREIIRYGIITLLFKIANIYNQATEELSIRKDSFVTTVEKFKSLINANFIEERSVQFYADQMHITAKHLSKVVKNKTGHSPSFWINKAIILEAKALLQNSSLSISDVAYKLQFDDPSNFSKYFKRNTNHSPKSYIKSLDS